MDRFVFLGARAVRAGALPGAPGGAGRDKAALSLFVRLARARLGLGPRFALEGDVGRLIWYRAGMVGPALQSDVFDARRRR